MNNFPDSYILFELLSTINHVFSWLFAEKNYFKWRLFKKKFYSKFFHGEAKLSSFRSTEKHLKISVLSELIKNRSSLDNFFLSLDCLSGYFQNYLILFIEIYLVRSEGMLYESLSWFVNNLLLTDSNISWN